MKVTTSEIQSVTSSGVAELHKEVTTKRRSRIMPIAGALVSPVKAVKKSLVTARSAAGVADVQLEAAAQALTRPMSATALSVAKAADAISALSADARAAGVLLAHVELPAKSTQPATESSTLSGVVEAQLETPAKARHTAKGGLGV